MEPLGGPKQRFRSRGVHILEKTCESWNGKRVQIGESNCTVFGFLVVLVRRAFRFLVALLVLLALAC